MHEAKPISRLFAVEAERLLSEKRAAEAVELCEAGLQKFPDYPTAYGILARAYSELQNYELAQSVVLRALNRFPLNKYLLRLKGEVDSAVQEKFSAKEFLKNEPEIVVENEELAAEELIIDDEIISEDDIQEDTAIESDPSVVEISETEAENEREEFEEVFKNDDGEALAIDDEIISEGDVEEDVGVLSDPAVEEIPEEEAKTEREEFEEVFKNTIDEVLNDKDPFQEEFLKEIPTEQTSVVYEVSKPSLPASANDVRYSPLRIIETFKAEENSRKSLKSSSVRLIPGLEFAPLRFEGSKKYDRHISALTEPPQFRVFKNFPQVNFAEPHPSMFKRMEEIPPQSSQGNLIRRRAEEAGRVAQTLTPLEELVTRLEKARIPTVQEDVDPQAENFASEPSVMTETMAKIYEQQGALAEALKAYQVLARQRPERLEFYEEKIREIQLRLSE